MKAYVINYNDDNAPSRFLNIGLFYSRELAWKWLLNFGAERCADCDLSYIDDHTLVVTHPTGAIAEFKIQEFQAPGLFLDTWNV